MNLVAHADSRNGTAHDVGNHGGEIFGSAVEGGMMKSYHMKITALMFGLLTACSENAEVANQSNDLELKEYTFKLPDGTEVNWEARLYAQFLCQQASPMASKTDDEAFDLWSSSAEYKGAGIWDVYINRRNAPHSRYFIGRGRCDVNTETGEASMTEPFQ